MPAVARVRVSRAVLTAGARTLQRRVGSAWLTSGGRVGMDPALAAMLGEPARLYDPARGAMVTPGDGEPFLHAMLAAFRGLGAFAVVVREPREPAQLVLDL